MLSWFKRWWKWLLVALAIVGAFIAGLFTKKKTVVAQDDGKKKKVEEDVTKKEDDDQKSHDQDVEDVTKKHEHDIQVVVEDEQKKVKDLEDPQDENDFIKKVGKDIVQ